MREADLPNDLTPLNLKAYFGHAFGACGCSDLESMVSEVLRLLEWHQDIEERVPWDEVCESEGMFYVVAGLIDNLGLSEHGVAIRHPWLTERGEALLHALQSTSAREIERASGEAYDGLTYMDD